MNNLSAGIIHVSVLGILLIASKRYFQIRRSMTADFEFVIHTAGVGGHSYMNYLKVPAKVDELCVLLQEKQKTVGTFWEQYELSFNAHLNLVTIHPWVDGDGRTAWLLMNYLQFCYHLFPTNLLRYLGLHSESSASLLCLYGVI